MFNLLLGAAERHLEFQLAEAGAGPADVDHDRRDVFAAQVDAVDPAHLLNLLRLHRSIQDVGEQLLLDGAPLLNHEVAQLAVLLLLVHAALQALVQLQADGGHVLGGEGLEQIIEGAVAHGLLHVFKLLVAGDDHGGKPAPLGVQRPHQRDAVHVGHVDVQEHGVDLAGAEDLQRLHAAEGALGFKQLQPPQRPAHPLDNQPFIVNDQNSVHASVPRSS